MVDNAIDISIVVPVYNSAKTISTLAKRILDAMDAGLLKYELILTDDRSTDLSWQEIAQVCYAHEQIVGVRLADNCGQWRATAAGMSMATGRYIVTIDDDLEYDPGDILQLYQDIVTHAHQVVFGIVEKKYRLQGKSPRFARYRNKVLNTLWSKPLTDSFRILDRNLIFHKDVFILQQPVDVLISRSVPAASLGYSPVSYARRYDGVSNYKLVKKLRLFFEYNAYFSSNLTAKLSTWGSACVLDFCLIGALATKTVSHPYIAVLYMLLAVSLIMSCYYLCSIFIKPAPPLYAIADIINKKS